MQKHLVVMQVWLATRKKTKGQSLAEYGLILALIAVVAIAALTTMGKNLNTMLTGIATTLTGVATAPGG